MYSYAALGNSSNCFVSWGAYGIFWLGTGGQSIEPCHLNPTFALHWCSRRYSPVSSLSEYLPPKSQGPEIRQRNVILYNASRSFLCAPANATLQDRWFLPNRRANTETPRPNHLPTSNWVLLKDVRNTTSQPVRTTPLQSRLCLISLPHYTFCPSNRWQITMTLTWEISTFSVA